MLKSIKTWFTKQEDEKNADEPKKAMTPSQNIDSTMSSDEFLTRYLEFLKGAHMYLKFKGLSHGHIPSVALNNVYIALKATAGEGYVEERHIDFYKSDQEADKSQRSKESVHTHFLETDFYQAEEQSQHKLSLASMLTEHQRLIIVGEPGSGKTTLLEYLILKMVEKPSDYKELLGFNHKPIPLYFQIRDLKPNSLPTPKQFKEICVPEALHDKCPNHFFEKFLETGCIVFFFDGLDEATRPAERRKIASWIDDLCATFPKSYYIVTSRIIGYREAPLHNGFHKFRLCDFDNQDIRQFVANWQDTIDESREGENESERRLRIIKDVDRLIEIMRDKPGIRQLASNPLLLTIVLLVYNSRARLPEERGRLYDECVDVLLEHIQKARLDQSREGSFKPTQGLKLEQQRDLLKSMAMHFHKNGIREQEESLVCNNILANQLPAIGLDPSEAEPFIKEVEERSGLIIHRGSGVGFSHLTFQEYLTALALCDREDVKETIDFLTEHRLRSWWNEVIQLYAASTVDATSLIQQLMEVPDTNLHHSLLLAGQCLADARKVKDLELRKLVIQKLADLYQSTPFTYIRFQARQVLIRIGTPEVAHYFINVLETGDENIILLRDAVEILSRLHTGTDIKAPLIRLLSKSNLPEQIKQTALRGLQNVGQFDGELKELLFSFMSEEHSMATRQEAVVTLSVLTSEREVIQRIRKDILENEKYVDKLDEIHVATAKGFMKHIDGNEALNILKDKMIIPNAAEYKVELCRALTYLKISEEDLLETLVSLLKSGIDWGARGGAALALGLLKHNRESIAHELAHCLSVENDIGVRLRIAEALGHLGWHDKRVDKILRSCLDQETHFHTRWKLTEAYVLLTRQESFIEERIVKVIADTKNHENDDKRFQAFNILNKLEYYTDPLSAKIIMQLTDYSNNICKQALVYLSAAPAIPNNVRDDFKNYLNKAINDKTADLILRNRAFETLYNLYDILYEESLN